ncbi:RICIN domain-containing protein [Yinghuangia seranimata]|uniref:RICIN domain-containing protein n=1 Tax=Yinghuangia seranimata TaxID=408067 RepID=UPI00248CDCA6|nr:RICIN domain-containing protein [Yinghuangia seranimata]MDI2129450.1 RICIN domain-containing protein [Yinghuangia seranimata]
MLVAATVTAALVMGAVAVDAALDGDPPTPGSVDAASTQGADPGEIGSPASAPLHKDEPEPLTSVPKNDVGKGMVYTGLVPSAKGDKCVGVYTVSEAGLCTHGPDEPPKGVDIHQDTKPVAAPAAAPAAPAVGADSPPSAADLLKDAPPVIDVQSGAVLAADAPAAGTPASEATAAAGAAVVCDGDGSTGNRVQVLYVHAPGNDRFGQYLPSIKKWAADADVIYNASAQETGGTRHIRYVTESDCSAVVLNVELPASELQQFGATTGALAKQGFNRKDRKYMIFADAQVYCGIGTFAGDERPGKDNMSNFGPSYGRTDNGCWSGSTAAHELGHNLGAVNNSAPNSSKAGHCVDEWDVMCYSDSPYYPKMQIKCPDRGGDQRLDCNHDDYYNTNPPAGSYLTTHWNVANNQFLIAGGGTGPNPTPTPTTSPTKTPTGDPTPTPSPTKTSTGSPTSTPRPTKTSTGSPTSTPSPTPTGGPASPKVAIGQLTASSVVLSWAQVTDAASYDVVLNGRTLGTVHSTVVRLVNLRPDTAYKVAVAVRDQAGHVAKPGPEASFRTPKAADPVGPTKPGTKYVMVNTLTGQAADMWGASTADGAVLIGYQRHGYANQQWLFEDQGNGNLRIRSVRSDKCLQIGGSAVAGQYVMQQPCSNADTQQWKITASGGGYTLTAKNSSLVLGTGNRWYYGGRLLELQQPNGQTYQNWAIQPVS